MSSGGSATWLGAGLLGVGFVPLFVWLAFNGRHFSPKLLLGAAFMGTLAVWAFKTWWSLRAIAVALHAGGIRHRSAETTTIEIAWSDVRRLEGQYVLGLGKRGTSDEGNRVTLVVGTATGSFELPKELEGARELWRVIEERCGKPLEKVLISGALAR